jgi:hypothetical protein
VVVKICVHGHTPGPGLVVLLGEMIHGHSSAGGKKELRSEEVCVRFLSAAKA